LEEILKQLLDGQKQVLNRLDNLEGQMNNLEGQMGSLEGRMVNLEGQTKENTGFIKALVHQTEEINAQFDGLLHTMVTKEAIHSLASKEDINKINAKFEVLNSRLFHQEAEIHELKAVK